MSDLNFISGTGEPDEADRAVLVTGMLAYHAAHGHVRETKKFYTFIKDKEGKVRGAILYSFLWNAMHIDSLWVDESLRGQGLGRKLMEMAEIEAKTHGCTIAHTDTFTWQAPGFYAKLGYTVYGKLENHPEGNTLTYFKKDLV
jgi:ribosomal protein S18 acetylase RimI-like enzyme